MLNFTKDGFTLHVDETKHAINTRAVFEFLHAMWSDPVKESDRLIELECWFTGLKRFIAGEAPLFSEVAETTECGYGILSTNGFWEFPVPYELVEMKKQLQEKDALLKEILAAEILGDFQTTFDKIKDHYKC